MIKVSSLSTHTLRYKYFNPRLTLLALLRAYEEEEGECQTAYILCVTAVHTVHDLCNDIHVGLSNWNVTIT